MEKIELSETSINAIVIGIAQALAEIQSRPEKPVGIKELAIMLDRPEDTIRWWATHRNENGMPCLGGKPLKFQPSKVLRWLSNK